MSVHVSAPGKLFLLGEYAVLDGAPALLTAVDRRVHIHIDYAAGSHWHLSAPDIGIDRLTLAHDGSLPTDLDAATRERLCVYAAVRASVARQQALPHYPLAIHIDSSAFHANGHKLGLGSSAAVAAALTAALTHVAGGRCERDALCRQAITAHRHAQNGTGSGADVATSIYGDVISYRADTVQATRHWPSELAGMAVETGDGASTTELVARVRALAERDPGRYQQHMTRLARLATDAQAALADATRFMHLAHTYFAELQALDAHARAGIVLPRHRDLAALAAHHGGVFKTSGAGGGDLGLVFAPRGAPAERLVHALTAAGSPPTALAFGAAGLQYNI